MNFLSIGKNLLDKALDSSVLVKTIQDGIGILSWSIDSFAYAEGFDEEAGRYLGLRAGQQVSILTDNLTGMVVKPEVALRQIELEKAETEQATGVAGYKVVTETGETIIGQTAAGQIKPDNEERQAPRRFHGTVELDPARAGRDAGKVTDEVISHLVGLMGSKVKVMLEIDAQIPNGSPEKVVRIVTANCRTLKFSDHGFEEE